MTTFYYKVITKRSEWYIAPIEPLGDPTTGNGADGWLVYSGGIVLTQLGENMVYAIAVRGGEFQAHSALIVSLDVPYSQVTMLKLQSSAGVHTGDSDFDPRQIGGILDIYQGKAATSSTYYSAYWGKTKDTFLTNATGHRLPNINTDPIMASKIKDVVSFTLEQNTELPLSATHILISSTNKLGENNSHPTFLLLYDSTGSGNTGAIPSATALDVDIVDSDSTRGKVEGTIYIHSAIDTTTVQSYNVYWGSSSTAKLG